MHVPVVPDKIGQRYLKTIFRYFMYHELFSFQFQALFSFLILLGYLLFILYGYLFFIENILHYDKY